MDKVIKLTSEEQAVYLNLSYDWQSIYVLKRLGATKEILDKLLKLGLIEANLDGNIGSSVTYYRKSTKRGWMVG